MHAVIKRVTKSPYESLAGQRATCNNDPCPVIRIPRVSHSDSLGLSHLWQSHTTNILAPTRTGSHLHSDSCFPTPVKHLYLHWTFVHLAPRPRPMVPLMHHSLRRASPNHSTTRKAFNVVLCHPFSCGAQKTPSPVPAEHTSPSGAVRSYPHYSYPRPNAA